MNRPSKCTESYDSRFDGLVLFNAELECLANGFRWVEGPVWFGDHNCFLFNDIPNNRTLRWSEQHGITPFLSPSDYANGQTRDGKEIDSVSSQQPLPKPARVGRDDHHSREPCWRPSPQQPNDVAVKRDGSIWFSDPLYGLVSDYEGGRQQSEQPPALYRIDPIDGSVKAMVSDFDGPNGLAFSPDEKLLYVAESGAPGAREPKQYRRVLNVSDDG